MLFQYQLDVFILEHAEMPHEQLVLKVMDIVQVGDVFLVLRAVVRDDVFELNKIKQQKGEFAQIESDPAYCF